MLAKIGGLYSADYFLLTLKTYLNVSPMKEGRKPNLIALNLFFSFLFAVPFFFFFPLFFPY